ncbi:MAG: GNAT family N-acetyltransferase [Candidatus Babeliales bacterium]|nr:GNAT family N-acetyltransferase [Candidatus Babeliales bacterium]
MKYLLSGLLIFLLPVQGLTMQSEQLQELTLLKLKGPQAKKYVTDIADMRITLFKEFPYLYEGAYSYEEEYLQTYFNSDEANILLVLDKDKVVGFSSSIPLAEESQDLKAPFNEKELYIKDYFYIGEVMLQPAYRGRGILRKFLEFHENQALKNGYKYTVFMTVDRENNHPSKPKDYKSLDNIWKHFGYVILPELKISLDWPQVGTNIYTNNKLSIWLKDINK